MKSSPEDRAELGRIHRLIKTIEAEHRDSLRKFRWFFEYLGKQYEIMTDQHRADCVWCLNALATDPQVAETDPRACSVLRFSRKASRLGLRGKVVMVNPEGRKLVVFEKNVPQYLREGYRLL